MPATVMTADDWPTMRQMIAFTGRAAGATGWIVRFLK
jgi:hypothetical protein